jgi:hypothetical protein
LDAVQKREPLLRSFDLVGIAELIKAGEHTFWSNAS